MLKKIISSFQVRYPQLAAKIFNEIPLKPVDEINSDGISNWSFQIPNHVYMTWENNAFGKTHANELKKFRNRNKDCHFHFFDKVEQSRYMKEYFGNHPIYPIYVSAKAGAMKADIWRYCILYERGGFYFDINKSINIPLNQLLGPVDQALLAYENNLFQDVLPKDVSARLPLTLPAHRFNELQFIDRPLLNWGLAFVPGHLLLKKTIDNIVSNANFFRNKKFLHIREPIIEFTGPIMLTRSFYDYLREDSSHTVTQCGIDFHLQANPNLPGSWVRYITSKSYVRQKNMSIL